MLALKEFASAHPPPVAVPDRTRTTGWQRGAAAVALCLVDAVQLPYEWWQRIGAHILPISLLFIQWFQLSAFVVLHQEILPEGLQYALAASLLSFRWAPYGRQFEWIFFYVTGAAACIVLLICIIIFIMYSNGYTRRVHGFTVPLQITTRAMTTVFFIPMLRVLFERFQCQEVEGCADPSEIFLSVVALVVLLPCAVFLSANGFEESPNAWEVLRKRTNIVEICVAIHCILAAVLGVFVARAHRLVFLAFYVAFAQLPTIAAIHVQPYHNAVWNRVRAALCMAVVAFSTSALALEIERALDVTFGEASRWAIMLAPIALGMVLGAWLATPIVQRPAVLNAFTRALGWLRFHPNAELIWSWKLQRALNSPYRITEHARYICLFKKAPAAAEIWYQLANDHRVVGAHCKLIEAWDRASEVRAEPFHDELCLLEFMVHRAKRNASAMSLQLAVESTIESANLLLSLRRHASAIGCRVLSHTGTARVDYVSDRTDTVSPTSSPGLASRPHTPHGANPWESRLADTFPSALQELLLATAADEEEVGVTRAAMKMAFHAMTNTLPIKLDYHKFMVRTIATCPEQSWRGTKPSNKLSDYVDAIGAFFVALGGNCPVISIEQFWRCDALSIEILLQVAQQQRCSLVLVFHGVVGPIGGEFPSELAPIHFDAAPHTTTAPASPTAPFMPVDFTPSTPISSPRGQHVSPTRHVACELYHLTLRRDRRRETALHAMNVPLQRALTSHTPGSGLIPPSAEPVCLHCAVALAPRHVTKDLYTGMWVATTDSAAPSRPRAPQLLAAEACGAPGPACVARLMMRLHDYLRQLYDAPTAVLLGELLEVCAVLGCPRPESLVVAAWMRCRQLSAAVAGTHVALLRDAGLVQYARHGHVTRIFIRPFVLQMAVHNQFRDREPLRYDCMHYACGMAIETSILPFETNHMALRHFAACWDPARLLPLLNEVRDASPEALLERLETTLVAMAWLVNSTLHSDPARAGSLGYADLPALLPEAIKARAEALNRTFLVDDHSRFRESLVAAQDGLGHVAPRHAPVVVVRREEMLRVVCELALYATDPSIIPELITIATGLAVTPGQKRVLYVLHLLLDEDAHGSAHQGFRSDRDIESHHHVHVPDDDDVRVFDALLSEGAYPRLTIAYALGLAERARREVRLMSAQQWLTRALTASRQFGLIPGQTEALCSLAVIERECGLRKASGEHTAEGMCIALANGFPIAHWRASYEAAVLTLVNGELADAASLLVQCSSTAMAEQGAVQALLCLGLAGCVLGRRELRTWARMAGLTVCGNDANNTWNEQRFAMEGKLHVLSMLGAVVELLTERRDELPAQPEIAERMAAGGARELAAHRLGGELKAVVQEQQAILACIAMNFPGDEHARRAVLAASAVLLVLGLEEKTTSPRQPASSSAPPSNPASPRYLAGSSVVSRLSAAQAAVSRVARAPSILISEPLVEAQDELEGSWKETGHGVDVPVGKGKRVYKNSPSRQFSIPPLRLDAVGGGGGGLAPAQGRKGSLAPLPLPQIHTIRPPALPSVPTVRLPPTLQSPTPAQPPPETTTKLRPMRSELAPVDAQHTRNRSDSSRFSVSSTRSSAASSHPPPPAPREMRSARDLGYMAGAGRRLSGAASTVEPPITPAAVIEALLGMEEAVPGVHILRAGITYNRVVLGTEIIEYLQAVHREYNATKMAELMVTCGGIRDVDGGTEFTVHAAYQYGF